jgi:hypothetical protein
MCDNQDLRLLAAHQEGSINPARAPIKPGPAGGASLSFAGESAMIVYR